MTQINDRKPESRTDKNQGNWWLVVGVVALMTTPLVFIEGEYNGADGQAHDAITEIQPNYEPWLEHITKPASGEVESFLFATQAALGAGMVGYVIGLYKGRQD